MPTNDKTRKTLIRKKLRSIEDLDDAEKYSILSKYKVGTKVVLLANEFNVSENTIKQFIHKEFAAFTNAHETNALITTELCHDPLKRSRDINGEFLRLIEEDGAALAYAHYFAKTGDNRLALRETGLDVGIMKAKGTNDRSVLSALRLRGIYLRNIPEVAKEIREIRDIMLKENPVTKEYVQSLLVDQIQEMKELSVDDPRIRGTLLKSIEMLGKSIGAFTERIEMHEVKADEALDTLIEMAESTYTVIEDD